MESCVQKFPLNFVYFAPPGPWPCCSYCWSVVQLKEGQGRAVSYSDLRTVSRDATAPPAGAPRCLMLACAWLLWGDACCKSAWDPRRSPILFILKERPHLSSDPALCFIKRSEETLFNIPDHAMRATFQEMCQQYQNTVATRLKATEVYVKSRTLIYMQWKVALGLKWLPPTKWENIFVLNWMYTPTL